MLRAIIFLVVLGCSSNLLAQNLLANGSLNDRNICTEYSATCAPEAWFFIPGYTRSGVQDEGNSFEILSMGLASRSVEGRRNYIYTKILCKLKAGKQYSFSVWVSTARNNFDHLEVWLGDYEPARRLPGVYITTPAFTITPQHEDSIKTKWIKYSYVYTAKGGEQYLMLGNLSSEGMQGSKLRRFKKDEVILYGVDNISLTAVEPNENNCPEYDKVLRQLYDQNNRHPPGLIEDIKTEKLPETRDTTAPKKELVVVNVDTPPLLRKPIEDTLTIPDVLFLFNSSKLNPAFTKELDAIVEKLKDKAFKGLEITGHTDNKGNDNYNEKLSKARASAIKDYLVKKVGLNPQTITIKGMGETSPVASNATAEGRQKNRRVEIILKY